MMDVFCGSLYSWRRALRLATLVVVIASASATSRAQNEDAASPEATTVTPYSLFQYSTLTGSGNTVTATWLPVVTSAGTTYKDVTLLFDVDSKGNLTLAPNYPKVVPSARPLVSAFRAGNYKGPSTILSGKALITVSGPAIAAGGATEWSLTASSGAETCTYPDSATWYVGPTASNPLAARIKQAGITSQGNIYYGVGGSQCGGSWYADTLLGFVQIGKQLTIYSYSYGGTGDHPTPVDQITYTLRVPENLTP